MGQKQTFAFLNDCGLSRNGILINKLLMHPTYRSAMQRKKSLKWKGLSLLNGK